MLRAVFQPGDPCRRARRCSNILLLSLGLGRVEARRAAEVIELSRCAAVSGRPDISKLAELFDDRSGRTAGDRRAPFWFTRISAGDIEGGRAVRRGVEAGAIAARREDGGR